MRNLKESAKVRGIKKHFTYTQSQQKVIRISLNADFGEECVGMKNIPRARESEKEVRETSTPGLVKTTFSNVANPLNDIVIRIIQFRLKNLQESNPEARRCKGNLQHKYI